MARRLSLTLSRTQVRMVHDDASEHEAAEADAEVRQRWGTIVREAKRALAFDERTAAERDPKGRGDTNGAGETG